MFASNVPLDARETEASETPAMFLAAPARYLAITGKGAPGGAQFQASIEDLYSVGYTVKALAKSEGQEFVVTKLELLLWADGDAPLDDVDRSEWNFQLMLALPDAVEERFVVDAQAALEARDPNRSTRRAHIEVLDEGRCVQVLHVGPYDKEPESIRKLIDFIRQEQLRPAGRHHEIYLSDPRHEAPKDLRTILRWPVQPVKP